jgi:hypothetical protein
MIVDASLPHLGETLHEDVLPALGLTITEAAKQLGVPAPPYPVSLMASQTDRYAVHCATGKYSKWFAMNAFTGRS